MIRLVAIVVVLWPRSPLARDEQVRPTVGSVARPRPNPAAHRGRAIVFAHATPDGPRIKTVTGD